MSFKIKNFLMSEKGERFKNFVFGFQDGLISTYILLVGIAMLVRYNPTFLIVTLIAEVAAGAPRGQRDDGGRVGAGWGSAGQFFAPRIAKHARLAISGNSETGQASVRGFL